MKRYIKNSTTFTPDEFDLLFSFTGLGSAEIRQDAKKSDSLNKIIENHPELHFSGTIYRGIGLTERIWSQYKIDSIVPADPYAYGNAPSSWTTNLNVAISFSRYRGYEDEDGIRVVLQDNSQNKLAISRELVRGGVEAEVIYSGSVKFKILDIQYKTLTPKKSYYLVIVEPI